MAKTASYYRDQIQARYSSINTYEQAYNVMLIDYANSMVQDELKLEEQKEMYERMLKDKDDTIKQLQKTIDSLTDTIKIFAAKNDDKQDNNVIKNNNIVLD